MTVQGISESQFGPGQFGPAQFRQSQLVKVR
jgi:hypothetical protein